MTELLRKTAQLSRLREIKGWVREGLVLPPTATVLVAELECKEPGCPPLETMIAVLHGPGQRTQKKIQLAVVELTRELVIRLFSDDEVQHGA